MQAEHTNEIDATAPVTEQASAWWMLLNEGSATDADHRAFSDWVARSPERVSAYLQAAQLAQALRSPATQWPATPVDELIRAAATPGVARLPGVVTSASPPRRSMRLVPPLAVAGLFAAVFVAIGVYFFYPRTERFETALGEQRSVTLDDGSLVTLNTTSAIEVAFDKAGRRVTLVAGEALFHVAHETARPFDVTAGDVTVRAVGTQFNVDRHSPSTRVMVVEGNVEVSAGPARVPVGAGEQAIVAPQGTPQVSRVNAVAGTAWTRRQLIFENQSLGEIAIELNRYNRKTIDIQSESLRAEQVTGVFQSNDPASFLEFIARIPGVSIEAAADRYIVRMSEQP
jgi:transmembrane sensor